MVEIQSKQKKIITSWYEKSQNPDDDNYSKFISLWISFNTYCYAKYYKDSFIYSGIAENYDFINEEKNNFELIKTENILKIKQKDSKFKISIKKRFAESKIFNAFVKNNLNLFQELDEKLLNDLKESLKRKIKEKNEFFIINMQKKEDYSKDNDLIKMRKNNIIIKYDTAPMIIKNILYQIRCNIFHGEKLPYLQNDDSNIVKAAVPILEQIVKSIIEKLNN